jgi:hypothetical protein
MISWFFFHNFRLCSWSICGLCDRLQNIIMIKVRRTSNLKSKSGDKVKVTPTRFCMKWPRTGGHCSYETSGLGITANQNRAFLNWVSKAAISQFFTKVAEFICFLIISKHKMSNIPEIYKKHKLNNLTFEWNVKFRILNWTKIILPDLQLGLYPSNATENWTSHICWHWLTKNVTLNISV